MEHLDLDSARPATFSVPTDRILELMILEPRREALALAPYQHCHPSPPAMPQKFRQRGKKKSKKAQEEKGAAAEAVEQPAWTIDRGAGNEEAAVMEEDETAPAVEDGEAPEHIPIQEADLAGEQDRIDDVAPFGFVSPELKAYLKDAIASLHKMQAERDQDYEDGEEEPSEQLNLLRLAMLREMNGQELACATDGEASIALESVIEGLDDRRLRILADRMSGR